jgi:hypothetical protein
MATTTVQDRAEYVSRSVASALEPGGPLAVQLSDLVSAASGVAMEAAGLPDVDDRGADWPLDEQYVIDMVVDAISQAMFTATREYLEPDDSVIGILDGAMRVVNRPPGAQRSRRPLTFRVTGGR